MSAHSDFNAALESGDVRLVQRLSRIAFPQMPPASLADAEVSMHMARTQIGSINFKARAYSHRWLTERGVASQLPDHLKPKAERLFPQIVEGVLVSANSNSPILKPIMPLVQQEMSDAVSDCYANGDREPELVRNRIQEARRTSIKQLAGIVTGAR